MPQFGATEIDDENDDDDEIQSSGNGIFKKHRGIC
jgi:hypothetical protein